MKRALPAVLLLIFCGYIQAQAKPTPPTTTPVVQTPPAAPKKEVPAELTNGLIQWNALNQVVTEMKHKAGIDILETELQSRANNLLQLADKDGFKFDPATNSFVAQSPAVPAPAVKK